MKGENDLKGQNTRPRRFLIQFTWFDLLHNFYSQLPRSAVLLDVLTGLNGCIR